MTIPELLAPYKTRWIAEQANVVIETARLWASGETVPPYDRLPALASALRMPLGEIAEAAANTKALKRKSA